MRQSDDDQLLQQSMQEEEEAEAKVFRLNQIVVLGDCERQRVQQVLAEKCVALLNDGCPSRFIGVEQLMRLALFMSDFGPRIAGLLAEAGLALVPLEMVKGVGDGESVQAE
jgi:hypothetical protein